MMRSVCAMAKKEAEIEWEKWGSTALIIIDMQSDAMKTYAGHKKNLPRIKKLAEACRKKGIPVIHTLYVHKKDRGTHSRVHLKLGRCAFMSGSKGAEEVAGLYRKGDYRFEKTMYSSFFKTPLERILKKHKVKTLIITGLLTHCCVYTTAVDAYQRRMQVILVKDAISSYRKKLHNLLFSGFFRNSIGEVTTAKKLLGKIGKL